MKEFFKNLKFSWKYARNYKKEMLGYTFLSILSIFVSIIIPILSAKNIVFLTNSDFKQVLYISVVLLVVNIVQYVITYFIRYFSQIVYRETFKNIQSDLGKEVLRLSNKSIDDNSSGVFIQRLTNDTSKLADVFNMLTMNISDIITSIGILGAIFIVNEMIFIYIVAALFIIYVIEKLRINKYNKEDEIFRKKNEKVSGFIGELVRGIRDIKMLSAEVSFMNELDSQIDDVNNQRYYMVRTNRKYFLLIDSLLQIFDTILIFMYVALIIKGELTIASALVLHNYAVRLPYLVDCVGRLLDFIKDYNLSSSRIIAIFESEEFKKEKFGTKHLEVVNGDFEFQNVSFKYKKGKPILKDISFKVNANETVAFVGKSGAGKSTIFSLLCKMYDINKGKITIDGINIKELDKESIRGNITIISQNPYIFNMSIRDNLRLVKENLSEEDMIEACKLACFHDFVMKLPEGYDTVVGEGGISLSGGERQRLAIARAFVQKTEIILFDEATSALDNQTQAKIQKAIENMKKEYTILIIAHRLSTVINSDRILFLNDGKIEAEGTHQELLEICDNYRELYKADLVKDNE